jgi:hypothetical protein
MKLQAAGMIDPRREACATTEAWSVRPQAGDHMGWHLVGVRGQVVDGVGEAGDALVGGGRRGPPLHMRPVTLRHTLGLNPLNVQLRNRHSR